MVEAAGPTQLEGELPADLPTDYPVVLGQFTQIARLELDKIRTGEGQEETKDKKEEPDEPAPDQLELEQYEYYLNKDQLTRFLRARNFDIEKTTTMYV